MRTWLVCLLLVSPLAWADADPRFTRLRDTAEPLGGLGTFLEKYVGQCSMPELGGAECKQRAAAFRQKVSGKKFYMIVTEESAGMISMGAYDPRGEFTLHVTPFFAASDSALTHGAPTRTDGNGNPVLPYLTVKGSTPEGGSAQSVSRWVSMRALRLQIVFTPLGLWQLPKRGGGKTTGVRGRIDAMLVTVGRTGEPVGLYLGR